MKHRYPSERQRVSAARDRRLWQENIAYKKVIREALKHLEEEDKSAAADLLRNAV